VADGALDQTPVGRIREAPVALRGRATPAAALLERVAVDGRAKQVEISSSRKVFAKEGEAHLGWDGTTRPSLVNIDEGIKASSHGTTGAPPGRDDATTTIGALLEVLLLAAPAVQVRTAGARMDLGDIPEQGAATGTALLLASVG